MMDVILLEQVIVVDWRRSTRAICWLRLFKIEEGRLVRTRGRGLTSTGPASHGAGEWEVVFIDGLSGSESGTPGEWSADAQTLSSVKLVAEGHHDMLSISPLWGQCVVTY